MRVLMLAQSYAPIVGGVERLVEDLGRELNRRGHDVSVATLRQPAGGPEPRPDDIPVHTIGSVVHRVPATKLDAERRHAPPLPDPEATLALRRLVRRERPDVIHAHGWLLNSYLPLDRADGPAIALSMHDYGLVCATKRFLNLGLDCTGPRTGKCVRCAGDYYGGRLKGAGIALGARLAEPRLRRAVDVFLPVSTAVRDRCGIGADELHRVIPNFVGELPPPVAGDERLDALPAEPFIVYVGDVTIDKGGGQLLEAYRSLENPPPLVLTGRCYLREAEGIPGVVTLGRLPHRLAMEALRRSLFTVVPSLLPETFGLVALESAAAGKPVVASRIGGLVDVVVDGETGLLVLPGSRDELAAAMRRLIEDDALRARMGEAALRRVEEFRPEAIVPRFEEAYELAIANRREGAGLAAPA